MSETSSPEVRFVIEYQHGVENSLTTGSLHNNDGVVQCNWSDSSGTASQKELTEDDFRELWNQVSVLKIFKEHLVKKKAKPEPNPESEHVIDILFQAGDQIVQQKYLIPSESADAEFENWLKEAGHPGRLS